MISSDATKPATADTVNGLRKVEQLGGELNDKNIPAGLQTQRLMRKFGFAFETATVIASLAWGIAR